MHKSHLDDLIVSSLYYTYAREIFSSVTYIIVRILSVSTDSIINCNFCFAYTYPFLLIEHLSLMYIKLNILIVFLFLYLFL